MFYILDFLPKGHSLAGASVPSPRQDIDDDADQIVAFHRKVGARGLTHIPGLTCPCCPVVFRKAEMDSAGFFDQPDYHCGRACQ